MFACMSDVRLGDRACLCFVSRASLVSVCMMTESVCLKLMGIVMSFFVNFRVRMTSWVAVRVYVGMRLIFLLLLFLMICLYCC